MTLLLDTQVAVWWVVGGTRLADTHLLDAADANASLPIVPV